MPDDIDASYRHGSTERAVALRALLVEAKKLVRVGDVQWSDVEADLRLLAVNHVLRRQIEGMDAALALARSDLGHLSVAFVRPALEEFLWLKFLADLTIEDSNDLLYALGRYDALRSLSAQWGYIGDAQMKDLWYTKSFLDLAAVRLDEVAASLKELGTRFKWDGRLPSAKWIADRIEELVEYEYLHAASSRAIHFSMGEIMRRGWGEPGGSVVTDKPEFRQHLSEFSLDQLWRLFFQTLEAAMPLLERAGVYSEPLEDETMTPLLQPLLELGRVPLVHAAEWNLTPDGPLRLPEKRSMSG